MRHALHQALDGPVRDFQHAAREGCGRADGDFGDPLRNTEDTVEHALRRRRRLRHIRLVGASEDFSGAAQPVDDAARNAFRLIARLWHPPSGRRTRRPAGPWWHLGWRRGPDGPWSARLASSHPPPV